MDGNRSLHEVFAELVGEGSDPAALLAAAGHADLPEELLAEAIVSFADTAVPEVAEHLAPFVKGHSAIPADATGVDPLSGLDLLASAPHAVATEDEPPLGATTEGMDTSVDDSEARLDLAFGAGSNWSDTPDSAWTEIDDAAPAPTDLEPAHPGLPPLVPDEPAAATDLHPFDSPPGVDEDADDGDAIE